jgi:quercetin dioxygenase-like cupin family protein
MNQKKEVIEVHVPTILKKDGVMNSNFENENSPLSNITEIIKSHDNSISWCYRLVNTENNSATLISQLPGEGNRLHYHPDWNEWWYIIKGQWKWEIEGKEFIVKKDDIVFIEKGKIHKITAIGDEPAIRLAVSRADVPHIYTVEE